jgi:hypothetical protein
MFYLLSVVVGVMASNVCVMGTEMKFLLIHDTSEPSGYCTYRQV